jgi:hypothetical protein
MCPTLTHNLRKKEADQMEKKSNTGREKEKIRYYKRGGGGEREREREREREGTSSISCGVSDRSQGGLHCCSTTRFLNPTFCGVSHG